MSSTWSDTTLGHLVKPSTVRHTPKNGDVEQKYVGLEHIGQGTGKIIGHGTSRDVVSTKTVFKKGDLLYGKLRPYLNKVAVAPFDGICSTDILVFPSNDIVSSELLLYRLLQRDFVEFAQLNSAGVQHPRVKFAALSNFPISLPNKTTQGKIVAKIEELLSELDTSDKKLSESVSRIKIYKAAALNAAFQGVAKLHPESVTTIGDSFEVYIGATPSRKEVTYWNGSVNWVSSGEVAFKDIHDTKEKISEVGLAKSSTRIHPPGTVMLAMIGEGKTRGQAGIIRIPAAHNQNTAAIEVDESRNVPEYLYYFLMSEYDKTRNIGSGNNQKALNKSRVQAMKVPLPSKRVQSELVASVSELLSQIEQLETAVSNSVMQNYRLKQSILSKAFKGELV